MGNVQMISYSGIPIPTLVACSVINTQAKKPANGVQIQCKNNWLWVAFERVKHISHWTQYYLSFSRNSCQRTASSWKGRIKQYPSHSANRADILTSQENTHITIAHMYPIWIVLHTHYTWNRVLAKGANIESTAVLNVRHSLGLDAIAICRSNTERGSSIDSKLWSVYKMRPFDCMCARVCVYVIALRPNSLTTMNQHMCMRFVPRSGCKQSRREGRCLTKKRSSPARATYFHAIETKTTQTEFELCLTAAPVAFLAFIVEN